MRADPTAAPVRRRGWGILGPAGLAASLLAAAGCAGPAPARYHEMSQALGRVEATPPPARDGAVDDATLTGAPGLPGLDRGALVRAVLERNPTIQAARHGWGAALARYPQVTALEDPMLGYGVAPWSFGNNSPVEDAQVVDLTQAIPFPGKLRLRGEAALAEAEASRGDLEGVRLRLATMASMLLDDYAFATRALAINAEHIALLETFQRIALARYEAGEATQQDPLQAETELARLLQRELELETRLQVTGQQLNTLLHRRVDALLPPAPEVLEPPMLPFGDIGVAALSEDALAARPELEAAEARVRAREAEVGSARRDYYPDVTLVGNYNGRMPVDEVRPFVGIRFNLPIQLDRRRAAVDEARSRLASAQSQRARVADEVALAVHTTFAEYERAREVAALFETRLLPAARDRIAAARAGFETGRNSFLELIDSERDLRGIELDHAAAIADVSRRAAQLLGAVGRTPGLDGGQP